MYRINQHTTLGFILLFSCLILSCDNSQLDDCETLFIQNLGITNETYALIQNGDRFLTDDEEEQFRAAYFGEGSMEGNKDWSTFKVIIDAYKQCRKNHPLNRFEIESIKSKILSAFHKDSIGLIRNYATSDSLRNYQAAIRDTMESLNLRPILTQGKCWEIRYIENYFKYSDELLLDFETDIPEQINIHNESELLSYYYSTKIDCAKRKEETNRFSDWSWEYFSVVRNLQYHYGEQNIGIELIESLPRPNPADYKHLRGKYRRLDSEYEWLFE